ncbi:hypothetical protein BDV12DRAFT_199715 [Aspergillus spectabilis]
MDERYPVTKLLSVLLTRELVARLHGENTNSDPLLIITMVDTGFCHSRLSRENKGIEEVAFNLFKRLFARTSEVGARTIVAGISGAGETHGKYMVNGVVAEEEIKGFAVAPAPAKTGERL